MLKGFRYRQTGWSALALTAASLLMPSHAQTPATTEDAILILDASGSMWGQIDGVNKIVIAKDVVEGLVRSLPESQRIGLVAYGHRRKGDCSDIQMLSDVGGNRTDMIREIRGLSPKGKTPLSDSVQYAADTLNYKKKAATVILVSDGVETCAPDPCALAKSLEENGLDFTVHVIGFDVTEEERKSLSCIAEETGGEFLSADNAEELSDALSQVAAVSPAAQQMPSTPVERPQDVALKATMMLNGPDIQSGLNWLVVPAEGGDPVFEADNAGYAEFEAVPGDYTVTAVWTKWPHQSDRYAGDKSGTKSFTVSANRPSVITVPIDLEIPVSLKADAAIREGEPISVTWSGPDDLGAYVTVNGLEDGPRDQIYFAVAQAARDKAGNKTDTNNDGVINQDDLATTQIGGPSIEGEYEVRYVLSDPRLILARVPLIVNDMPHTLSVPDSVIASTEFEVQWTGDITPGDFLTIVPKGSDDVFTNGVTARLKPGEPARLTAIAQPGDYEVRYILANGYTTYDGMQYAVQESVPLKIVDVSVSIEAPETAVGGSTIKISLDLPGEEGWQDDMISVVAVGAVKTNSDARESLGRIRNDDGTFSLRVPAIEGDYEIAYFMNPGSRVVARSPLVISRAEAMLEAPDTAKLGENISVSYSGNAFSGDRVLIVPVDTPDDAMWRWNANYGFAAKAGETEGTINGGYAVKEAGEYEIRYVTGLQHQILARTRITITD